MLEIKKIKKCLIELEKLAQQGKYHIGLKTTKKYLRQYPTIEELLLKYAFFLYHHAADLKYSRNTGKIQTSQVITNFNQAIRICRKLIKREKFLSQRICLNARLYLAQMYAMLGKSKEAKKFANATYKYLPSTLTAERAADVYRRLNDPDGAMRWYQRAVKNAKKADERAMAHAGLATLYKHLGEVKKAIKEARMAIYFVKQTKQSKFLNQKLFIKILHSHIPELKKPHPLS